MPFAFAATPRTMPSVCARTLGRSRTSFTRSPTLKLQTVCTTASRSKGTIGAPVERRPQDSCVANVLLLDHGAAAAPALREVAGARPTRPEHEREQRPNDADDEQDVTDRVDVDPARRHVNRPRHDGSDGNENETNS